MPLYQAALLGWECPRKAWKGFGSYPRQEQELLELWEVAGTFLRGERGGNWPQMLILKPPGVLTPPMLLPALQFPAYQQVSFRCPGQGYPIASSWGPVSVDLEVQGAGLDLLSLETMKFKIYWRASVCSSPSSFPSPFLPVP